jgi:hypothetical protein
MPKEDINSGPRATFTYSLESRRYFSLTPQQQEVINARINEYAPAAISRMLPPSCRFPLGGSVRVVPCSELGADGQLQAYLEIRKRLPDSPDWSRFSQ